MGGYIKACKINTDFMIFTLKNNQQLLVRGDEMMLSFYMGQLSMSEFEEDE